MSETCETCKHWTQPSDRTDYRNIYRGDHADVQYGICDAITIARRHEEAPDPLPLAVTQDASDYQADLFTQAAFGCVMWEPKAT